MDDFLNVFRYWQFSFGFTLGVTVGMLLSIRLYVLTKRDRNRQ